MQRQDGRLTTAPDGDDSMMTSEVPAQVSSSHKDQCRRQEHLKRFLLNEVNLAVHHQVYRSTNLVKTEMAK